MHTLPQGAPVELDLIALVDDDLGQDVRGRFETSWHLRDHVFDLDVTVPANVTATVVMSGSRATEGGERRGRGRAQRHRIRHHMPIEIGSGTYTFRSFVER